MVLLEISEYRPGSRGPGGSDGLVVHSSHAGSWTRRRTGVGAGVAVADLTFAAIAAFGVTAVSSALLAGTFWIKLVGSMPWWVILTTLA